MKDTAETIPAHSASVMSADDDATVRPSSGSTSGLSASVVQRISERGARMARRDDRGYREYLREEQRSQPGCPARKALYK